ncbi:MAG: M10 family metallopeptidase C-terminal domain-containing protein [Rhodospirillaceae bacterium]|nr:M10 family metallopeptidase C-terminal domain-containing protein [Rhodospirillales bacterium]
MAETSAGSTATDTFPFPQFQLVEVRGTPGADVLIGTNANEDMQGFRGDDVLFGGAGDDSLKGGIGNDRLEGGPGFDTYDGGPGTDTLTFSVEDGPANVDLQNSSVVSSGVFEFVQNVENITGSVFGDTLLGDDNDNVMRGGSGLDLLGGGLGDDILDGGKDGAYATWAGEDGAVSVDLAAGSAVEWDGGQDILITVVGAIGTDFNDTMRGDAGANRLEGGKGDDTLSGRGGGDILVGGAGADVLQGGGGRDTVDYSGAGPVRVSLVSGEALDSSGAIDRLSGIEDIIGSLGQDTISGDGGANRLVGGVGADTLRGGGGADTFVFNDRLDFGDTIRDFQTGLDRMEVDAATVGRGTVTFDAAGSHLIWDADGSGPADPVVMATVEGSAVASSDLVLV